MGKPMQVSQWFFKDFRLQRPGVVFEGRFSQGLSHHFMVTFWKDERWPFPKNPKALDSDFEKKNERSRFFGGANLGGWWGFKNPATFIKIKIWWWNLHIVKPWLAAFEPLRCSWPRIYLNRLRRRRPPLSWSSETPGVDMKILWLAFERLEILKVQD